MYEELKKKVEKELEQLVSRGEMNMAAMEKIHKMTDIIKNCDKIEMLEEQGGYSEMGGSSYARGRSRGSSRDSMSRYYEDGSSYGGYSEEGSSSYRGYSRHEAKDHMMSKLGSMMEEADPKTREILKKCMRDLERD